MTDRERLWLPLLQSLTAAVPDWLVWKNVQSALGGLGDVDSAATPASWPEVVDLCAEWAQRFELGPVIECRHISGGVNLVVAPADQTTLMELSVKNTKSWRGYPLFSHADLLAMAEDDPRGFRRLRPGAEGVFKLLLNGTTWSGAGHAAGLRAKYVRAFLAADPDGVRQAAALLGPAESAALRMAAAVIAGDWDRWSALWVQSVALSRAMRSPGGVASRATLRLRTSRHCPVLRSLLHDKRQLSVGRELWWQQVRQDHVVHEKSTAPATSRGLVVVRR